MNLYHTWGDQTDCSGSDYVNDTPPCSDQLYGCPTTGLNQCSNQRRLIEDYMDYTDDACMNIFTKGQLNRMRSAIRTYGFRSYMVSTLNLTFVGFINQKPDTMYAVSDTNVSITLKNTLNLGSIRVLSDATPRQPIGGISLSLYLKSKPSSSSFDTLKDTLRIPVGINGVAILPSFSLDVAGDYEITASAKGLKGSPITYRINVAASSSLYPNPFQDVINIKLKDDNTRDVSIEIYDTHGKRVYLEMFEKAKGMIQVRPLVNPGTYIISIKASDIDEAFTIVKDTQR